MQIVVTSHGGFCTGALSVYQMVAGKPENITAVSLSFTDTGEFKGELREAVKSHLDEGVLILCDIIGGTPYNESYRLMLEHPDKVRLLANMNLPMLLEAGMALPDCKSLKELCDIAINAGIESIKTGLITPEGPEEGQEYSSQSDEDLF